MAIKNIFMLLITEHKKIFFYLGFCVHYLHFKSHFWVPLKYHRDCHYGDITTCINKTIHMNIKVTRTTSGIYQLFMSIEFISHNNNWNSYLNFNSNNRTFYACVQNMADSQWPRIISATMSTFCQCAQWEIY